ncbi:hypothetical protein ACG2LH_11345 [Zhouia sp. PK063]|uniref:hypothetical protein n=1 Tax=Zhouia sp. PK063 TaxID=3373602 RepID=UPI0037A5BC6E
MRMCYKNYGNFLFLLGVLLLQSCAVQNLGFKNKLTQNLGKKETNALYTILQDFEVVLKQNYPNINVDKRYLTYIAKVSYGSDSTFIFSKKAIDAIHKLSFSSGLQEKLILKKSIFSNNEQFVKECLSLQKQWERKEKSYDEYVQSILQLLMINLEIDNVNDYVNSIPLLKALEKSTDKNEKLNEELITSVVLVQQFIPDEIANKRFKAYMLSKAFRDPSLITSKVMVVTMLLL